MSRDAELQDQEPEDTVEDSHEIDTQEDESTEEKTADGDSKEGQSDETEKKESDWEGQDGADERERIAAEADKAAGLDSDAEEGESEKKENPDDPGNDSKEESKEESEKKSGEGSEEEGKEGDGEKKYPVTIYGKVEYLTLAELTERAEIAGATSELKAEFEAMKSEFKELKKTKPETEDKTEDKDEKEEPKRITAREVQSKISTGSDEEGEQALEQWSNQLKEDLVKELKGGESDAPTREEVQSQIETERLYAEGNAKAKAGLNAYFESDDGKEFTASQKKAELLRDSIAEECFKDLEKVGIKRDQIRHLNIERLMEGHQVHQKTNTDKMRSIETLLADAGTQTRKTIEELTGQPADQKPTETEVSDKSSEKEKINQPSRNSSQPPKTKGKSKEKSEQEVNAEARDEVISERMKLRD